MNLFKKDISNFSQGAFGLDLSDLSVKVIQLKGDGNEIKLKSYGSVAIPLGSISDGEIIKKENVVVSIKKAIEKAEPEKIRSKKVICSLPETKGFLRIINLPKMDEEEIREAIKWEIEANIPLSVDQVCYDWQLLDKVFGKQDDKISVLVVAVSKKTVNQFLEVLELSGLEPMGLEIESIAQARSLIGKNEEKNALLIIDVGDRRTTFLILLNGIPCFTASVPLSAQSITDGISKSLNISVEEAEKKKFEFGIGSMAKKDPIFKAVEPVLENLIAEIEKSMNFYLESLQYSSAIDEVIICGGGANTKGLISYLSIKINKEISIGNPWVNFYQGDRDLPLIEKNKSIKFSTAIGLALKGLEI